jgi:hypothetical protein
MEVPMTRFLPRLAALAALGLAGGIACGQTSPIPTGVPTGSPYPPGGSTDGANGFSRNVADQVDEMNRHINGEHHGGGRNSTAPADRARPATAADVIAGAAVSDSHGVQLGMIESVDASGAVILTAVGRARIPVEAFGKNAHGLLLQTTKAQFEASVAQANATPS